MTTLTLTQPEQESLLTVGLMAAFADGGKSDVERAEIKRIAESLSDGGLNANALYQRVLLRQVTLADAVEPLTRRELRQLAYEMAVCVCEADESLNDAEKEFLGELGSALGLGGDAAETFQSQADALAEAPLQLSEGASAGTPPVLERVVSDAEVERMILNCAILNGALELLPDSLATLAIVPLQMNMVYRIGKRHGYELDRHHIRELLGTAGLGLTSQVVEGFARKLIGGLLGKMGGGLGRGMGRQLAGSAMSFASTYAIGQVAQKYYSGGRQLSTAQLQELFTSLTGKARSMHERYSREIQDRAGRLKLSELADLVRRQSPNIADS